MGLFPFGALFFFFEKFRKFPYLLRIRKGGWNGSLKRQRKFRKNDVEHLKNRAGVKEKDGCDPGGQDKPAETENCHLATFLTFRLCDCFSSRGQ